MLRILALILPFYAVGCESLKDIAGGGGGKDSDEEPDPFLTATTTAASADGEARVNIDVKDGVTAFMLSASTDTYVDVEEVINPDGESVLYWRDWYYEVNWLTSAIFPLAEDTVLNWPIREEEGTVEAGTWTIVLGTYSRRGAPTEADLDITVNQKRDDDFSKGLVGVRIVYADGVMGEDGVVEAVEAAVERWREIWAGQGLELEEEYADSDIDPDLSSPSDSTDWITSASEDTNGRQVTVIIGERIDNDLAYFGVAGGIPGSLASTPHSAVVVSWLANAGGDAEFSDGDIRLFGETMAHEVGHFLGLFHPVESSFNAWDSLEDTDECSSQRTCESALGENLMYPYPLCDWSGDCDPQGDLTDDQGGVGNRYTGTN